MSWQLVVEVMDHAPRGLTVAERFVLVVLAEYVGAKSNLPARVCECSTADIARRTDLTIPGVKAALRRLAGRGLDVRMPLSVGKDGRPVYTYRGHVPRYRIPIFTPSVDCGCRECSGAQGVRAVTSSTMDGSVEAGITVTPYEEKGSQEQPEGVTATPGRGSPDNPPPVASSPVPLLAEAVAPVTPSREEKTAPPSDAARLADEIGATADEVHALVRQLAVERPNVSSPIAWLRRCHQSGDLAPMLREHRAERMRAQISRELDQARRDRSMECEHGTPGGRYRRPDNGKSPCAQCRYAKAEV